MDSYQDDWDYYNSSNENITRKNSRYNNNYSYYPSGSKSNYSTNVINSSKYTRNNLNENSTKKTDVGSKYNKYINNNTGSDSTSSQYYSQKNKYLITFNSNPRKIDSNKDISSDGVIRGYTNNCSFYVSGSSDLKQKLKDFDKRNKKVYVNSAQKNENKPTNNYNRYINYSNNITRKDNNISNIRGISNNISKIYTNSNDKNYGQNRYNSQISLKKRNEQKKIINYTQTEPSNNVIYYSQKTAFTPTINTTYISSYNKDNKDNKENNNNITTNPRRIYKTSTNTNLNNINSTNYFKTETEQKENRPRRNNTPNTLSFEDKYLSNKDDKNKNKTNYNKINININKTKEKSRHTASEIPHNFNREKYSRYNIDNSSSNNTNRNPFQIIVDIIIFKLSQEQDNMGPEQKGMIMTIEIIPHII